MNSETPFALAEKIASRLRAVGLPAPEIADEMIPALMKLDASIARLIDAMEKADAWLAADSAGHTAFHAGDKARKWVIACDAARNAYRAARGIPF